MVFYEAPHKLPATLRDMALVLGERRIALVRELTKIHEEVIRTTLPEAAGAILAGSASWGVCAGDRGRGACPGAAGHLEEAAALGEGICRSRNGGLRGRPAGGGGNRP